MKILVLGDSHLPYTDFEVIEQAHSFAKKVKPDLVISTGDMTDQKFWSRFPKSPEDDGGIAEWEKVIKGAKEFGKMFPKLVILNSNHDRRYVKKASDSGIPKIMIRTLSELIPNPGWKWHLGPNPFIVGDIAFMHGDELNGGVKAKATTLGMNVVQGHSHKAELHYVNTFNKSLFAMDVGCTVDPKSPAFDYAASSLTKVWVGFGYIDNGVPHLIPKEK
jgi:predicted phosphodiesterase